MTRSGRMLKMIGITLAALILCLWLANEVYASRSRRVIEKAVAAVQQFRPNETTITEAGARLQAATGRTVTPTLDADGSKQIEYSLVVPQGGLRRLGRVFWFSITLKFDSTDRLASKRLLFTSNSYACCSAEVWELASLAGRETGEFQVARYDPYSIIVHLGPNASAVESQAAWNWQLSCLTSVAGCNDVRQVLPSLRPSPRTE
jgi:hypothetical protein